MFLLIKISVAHGVGGSVGTSHFGLLSAEFQAIPVLV